MQVVVNKNAGAFALTEAALLEVYHLDAESAAIKVVTKAHALANWKVFEELDYIETDDGNFIQAAPITADVLACPTLVSVVQRMGAQACGETADLAVVEVPDMLDAYKKQAGVDDPLSMFRRVRLFA